MRKTVLLVIVLLYAFGVGTPSHGQTVDVAIEILTEADSLVVVIEGNQPVAIPGFGFDVEGDVQLLSEYPAFAPVNFERLQPPVCFVLRTINAATPVPSACQGDDVVLVTQILQTGDLFWYDPSTLQFISVVVNNFAEQVRICPTGPGGCPVDFPALLVTEPTPTLPSSPETAQTITAELNLLTSADQDGDGLSDFEERIALQNVPGIDAETFNPDTDSDGVVDAIELFLSEINPSWATFADVDVAGIDRDGDFLFDGIELELGVDPDLSDTDGDRIGDFWEFVWLGTQFDQPNEDADRDGFPDVLEPFLLPEVAEGGICQFEVTLRFAQLQVFDPEEADTNDIIVGDEPIIQFGLQIVGDANNNSFRAEWRGEGIVGGDIVTDIGSIQRTVDCGDALVVYTFARESDEPFGGEAILGEDNIEIPIQFDRLPIAWPLQANPVEVRFIGAVQDGTYDYAISYDLEITPTP